MNGIILIANILTLLAFIIHAFIGDRELKIIQPTIGFAGRPYHTKMPDSFKKKMTSGQNRRLNQAFILG